MKRFIVFLLLLMAIPAHAALAPNWRHISDAKTMVRFLEKHRYVASELNSIDVKKRMIVFNGGCFAHFRVAKRKRPAGWVGPRAPLEFHWSTCPLTRYGELTENDKKEMAECQIREAEFKQSFICGQGPARIEDEVNFTTDINRSRFYRRFQHYKKKNPELKGSVVLRYDIHGHGGVTNIQVVKDTMGNEKLISDLKRILSRIKFPPGKAKMNGLELSFPFE